MPGFDGAQGVLFEKGCDEERATAVLFEKERDDERARAVVFGRRCADEGAAGAVSRKICGDGGLSAPFEPGAAAMIVSPTPPGLDRRGCCGR